MPKTASLLAGGVLVMIAMAGCAQTRPEAATSMAGDTPMVSITDFGIPGLDGTFTARVFFYEDRYGGSWEHAMERGVFGGLMYGHIEPMAAG